MTRTQRILHCVWWAPLIVAGCAWTGGPEIEFGEGGLRPLAELAEPEIESQQESSVHPVSYETEQPPVVDKKAEVHAPLRLPSPEAPATSKDQVIDLASALALGGADHLQVQLARERVVEAHANLIAARSLWLPSIRFGIGWNKHDGRLQETQGNVLEIDRKSLFIGAGAGLGQAPLPAGASGPARLFVNLSLADAFFEHLVAGQMLDMAAATESAVRSPNMPKCTRARFPTRFPKRSC